MKQKMRKVKVLCGVAFACICAGCVSASLAKKGAKPIAYAEEVTKTVDGFIMTKGASAKLTDGNGLRFMATLPDSLYKEGYTYGMLIAPAEYVETNAFTYENVFGKNAVYDWADEDDVYTGTKTRIINITYAYGELKTRTDTDDGYFLRGSLLNIKDENIARSFVGRAYAKDKEGSVTFAKYYDDMVANNTRSMYTIATAALADENSGLTTDQKETLETCYIDKLYTEATYTSADGYTWFIKTQATDSTSCISASTADFGDVSAPSGYQKMNKEHAQYAETYSMFENVDLSSYERLRFAVYPLDGAYVSTPIKGKLSTGAWTEIELVKKDSVWYIVTEVGEMKEFTDSNRTLGLAGNFAVTELQGIKSTDTAVRYHTITYYDTTGDLLHVEKVKEGAAATYSASKSTITDEEGYTYEYSDFQWTDENDAAADLSDIIADRKVYLSYSEVIWNTESAKTAIYPLSTLASINKYVQADESGEVTFYLRVKKSCALRWSDSTAWSSTYDDSASWIDANTIYIVVINCDAKELILWNGNTKVKSVTFGKLDLTTLSVDGRTSDTDFVQLEIGVKETVKYHPTYTIIYYDTEGNVLYTEKVEEGKSAIYAANGVIEITDDEGYTHEYTNVKWMTEQGGATEANLSSISADTKVYMNGTKTISYIKAEKYSAGAYPLFTSLNKYITASEDGSITFKIRLNGSAGSSFYLYETQGWSNNNYSVWLDSGWYTVTIDGATKHIVVRYENGEVYKEGDIPWYNPETLSICLNADMDIAAIW